MVSGRDDYHANIHMVLELIQGDYALVWEKRPEVKVWVVSGSPTILQQLAHPRIIVTGTVSDIRPTSRHLLRAPLGYGAGIKIKYWKPGVCNPELSVRAGSISNPCKSR